MRSLNWTDHANLTKQQQIDLVDIDLKHLRWVSEIIADGSEIRSLAGRSCRLGDGTSRNPADRDALMAQRTKDLEGMIGQVRGFDLDEFLSDWELEGSAVPWSIGDGGWIKESKDAKAVKPAVKSSGTLSLGAIAEAMSAEGVKPVLKILYCPDYVTRDQRIAATSGLYVQLSQLLPGFEISIALAEGPFEDDDGFSAHFEADALGKRGPTKQIPALKVDLHTSVVKLARHAALHKPKLIFGKGQGGLVATAYGHPGQLEQVLATRNVQPAELHEIGQAWGNVAAIIVEEPRLSKKGVQFANIKLSAPEMFQNYPVASRRTVSWKDSKILHYNDTKLFLDAASVEMLPSFGAIPFGGLLEEPPLLMWEHDGRCPCGKRSFLFGQCPGCLKEERRLKTESVEDEQAPEEPDGQVELVPEPASVAANRGDTIVNYDFGPKFGVKQMTKKQVKHMHELCCEPAGQRAELRITLGLLPRVRVRRGYETQHVTFLNDSVLKALEKYYDKKGGYDPLDRDWEISVASWAGTHKVYLPKSKKKDMCFRICFVVESSGDFIPLQQCVDTRQETTHFLQDSCWTVDQQELLKVWEPTAVSSFLDEVMSGIAVRRAHPGGKDRLCPTVSESRNAPHHEWYAPVDGPLKSLVKTALEPYHVGYLTNNNVSAEDSGWRLMKSCRKEPFPLGFGTSQMIVFARSRRLDRWIVFLLN